MGTQWWKLFRKGPPRGFPQTDHPAIIDTPVKYGENRRGIEEPLLKVNFLKGRIVSATPIILRECLKAGLTLTRCERSGGSIGVGIGERKLARELTFLEALTMGVGGIIGGGIYSVIGIVMGMTGPAVVFSFLFCSVTALLVGYNYVRLGKKYPLCGASYKYVSEAFPGAEVIRNVSGQILWLGYIVACGLYSVSFGLYASYLLPVVPARVYSLILVTGLLGLNLLGVGKAGRMQDGIVIGKILILGIFVLFGLFFIDTQNFIPFFPEGKTSVFAASSLIFIGYEGFEIIGTASEELKEAEKNLGRAVYGALLVASTLYVGVAVVSIGTAGYGVVGESSAPLAFIATRFLDRKGELLLGFGGLLSTSSALNAALFGASRLAFSMAREGGFPGNFAHLNRRTRVPTLGLSVSGFLIIFLAITGFVKDLSGLASLIFLIIFVMVCLSNYRLRHITRSRLPLIIGAIALCLYFIVYVDAVVWMRFLGLLSGVVVFNLVTRRLTGRGMFQG